MAIAENKKRIAITITEEQEKEFGQVADEMGITKSTLMQIATMQYVNAYKQSHNLISDTVQKALEKLINERTQDIDQLRS